MKAMVRDAIITLGIPYPRNASLVGMSKLNNGQNASRPSTAKTLRLRISSMKANGPLLACCAVDDVVVSVGTVATFELPSTLTSDLI